MAGKRVAIGNRLWMAENDVHMSAFASETMGRAELLGQTALALAVTVSLALISEHTLCGRWTGH